MIFLRPWSIVDYCDSDTVFWVQACFPCKGQDTQSFSCLRFAALNSSEAANLASSLAALFKAKSRISCVLGQEVFLLEGNLLSALNGLHLIHCTCLFASTMFRNSQ